MATLNTLKVKKFIGSSNQFPTIIMETESEDALTSNFNNNMQALSHNKISVHSQVAYMNEESQAAYSRRNSKKNG